MSRLVVASLLVACVGLAFLPLPVVDATHAKRIVLPYGEEERWLPIIAGYEVLPKPLACDGNVPAGQTLLALDFETPAELALVQPTMYWHNVNVGQPNLWHQTTFAGVGTDVGHGGPGKLYFGVDETGVFGVGNDRPVGAVAFTVDLPASDLPYHLTFNTKWAGQWNAGSDHMWVELADEDGTVYILCTLNPAARPTTAPMQVEANGACSPYREGPCFADARGPAAPLLALVDDKAPHWESRSALIPAQFNGRSLQIRFTFDAADRFDNAFLGWMLDDLVVTDLVVPSPSTPPL